MVGDCDKSAPELSPLARFGEAEVQDLQNAGWRDLDVRRFEIAVDDAAFVSSFKRLGDLFRDRQRFIDWHRPLRDSVGERRPLHHLQYQRRHSSRLFETVYPTDVGVIQGSQNLRFTSETRQPLRITRHRSGSNTLIATLRPSFVSRAR